MRLARPILSAPPLALVCTLPFGLAPGPADAGAWTREPGSLQLITTIGRRGAPFRAGKDEEELETITSQFYAEYGLYEGFTVGGKFWTDVPLNDATRGSAELGLFARKRLWRTDQGSVASVQVGGQIPIADWLSEDLGSENPFSTEEIELRALYGKGWWGDWGNAFVSLEGGYQLRFDLPDEARADAVAGIRPVDCCMALLGVYGLWPVEDGLTDESIRLAPSIVWHVRQPDEEGHSLSLQLGTTYDALQPEDGFGAFIGLWQSF